jgi:phytanoyl-CoA hydroxylase
MAQAAFALASRAFERDGFTVLRGHSGADTCARLRDLATVHHAGSIAPIEYEADLQYPGAPSSLVDKGGLTPRRLLQAYARDRIVREWATDVSLGRSIAPLLGSADVALSQCHHNCIMTKSPGFSSATRWHQDNRYWSFDRPNLVTAWLALGDEDKKNGCLRVIPGSHTESIERGRLDAELFLRTDQRENKSLVANARTVNLAAGDVLLFHSRLFHAAGRNLTDTTKYSVVFTYHANDNRPIAGTRSAAFPSIPLML